MPTVVLIRHGETTANARGVLAGRLPGVILNERGREQALAAGQRLQARQIQALVTSPLERTRQTAAHIRAAMDAPPRITVERRLTECDYGQWSGRKLSSLSKLALWQDIQQRPSAVTFPGGEAMAAMAARAVAAVREWDRRLHDEHGAGAVWVAVSHGDVIKAVVADALGVHLDGFQRIHIAPGSMSIISYGPRGTSVLAVNSHADVLPTAGDTPRGPTLGGGR